MSDPVRYVLARAAENGFFEAVVPAAQPFDPLVRGSIRKRARRAFARASESTKVTDEGHVLRLAFLQVANVQAPPPDDVENVRLAFEAAKVVEPRRGRAFWPVSFGAAAGLVVVAAVVAAVVLWPTPRQRFARSPLGEGMSDGLTDWTVGVARRDVDRQEKGRAVLMAKGVKRQIGDGAYGLLGTALEQSKAVAGALTPDDSDRETKALASTLRALDGELAAKKLPAYVDVYTDSASPFGGGPTTVWLIGYWVDDRATFTVGSKSVPILRGSRLDNLNLDVGGKAYESKALGGWVVSTDEVSQWVIANVVPALGKDRSFAFGARAAQQAGSQGRLDAKAGERIRADLLARAKLDPNDATALADLFVQRHDAFGRLAVLGDGLFEPRGLALKPKLYRALKRRKNEIDANEILRIEDRLGRFDESFDRIVAAQAGLDEIRVAAISACDDKCTIKADPDLAQALGSATLEGSGATSVASKLVMIARGDAPWLALAEAEMGSGGYATVFVVERELGLSPDWLGRWGVTDESEHGQLGVAAFEKPEDAIRKAAESAYQKLFATPLPAVTRVPAGKRE
jgi:hypothetical protein